MEGFLEALAAQDTAKGSKRSTEPGSHFWIRIVGSRVAVNVEELKFNLP